MRSGLWVLVIWHLLSHKTEAGWRGRQGEKEEESDRGEDRERRTKLTNNSLSDFLVPCWSKGWSMRETDRERERERETGRYQLHLCGLILTWSSWWLLKCPIINLSCVYSLTHKHTLSQYKKTQHTNTQQTNTPKMFTSCFVTLGASLPSAFSWDCRKCNKEQRNC